MPCKKQPDQQEGSARTRIQNQRVEGHVPLKEKLSTTPDRLE